MSKQAENLLEFVGRSPTPYHAVENVARTLKAKGFQRLEEKDNWGAVNPGKYYVTRNDSSLIALKLNRAPEENGFRMVGAHTDSPFFVQVQQRFVE